MEASYQSSVNKDSMIAHFEHNEKTISPLVFYVDAPPGIPEPLPYSGDFFWAFHAAYASIHGYLAVVICAVGIVGNLLSIAVLTRRSLVTPTTVLLTALIVVHTLLMMTYIPFVVHQNILNAVWPVALWHSYSWMAFIFFHVQFTIVFHSIAAWLTVNLTLFRCWTVMFPRAADRCCKMLLPYTIIAAVGICNVIFWTPSYLSVQIDIFQHDAPEYLNPTGVPVVPMYSIGESDLSRKNHHNLQIITFYACIAAKLLPCFLLFCLSVPLVIALLRPERHGTPLTFSDEAFPSNYSPTLQTAPSTAQEMSHPASNATEMEIISATPFNALQRPAAPRGGYQAARRDVPTAVVLVIAVVCILTDGPSGLLALSTCFSVDFFNNVFIPLGNVMDALHLLKGAVFLIILCSLSREFRLTFSQIWCAKRLASNGNEIACGYFTRIILTLLVRN
ncbi:G-protein coupled receptor dmsr-1-like isoform X2 [Paramacrobiotus metropolitanus]|uniref:G-protein coupled receptor dmsr-1-like isoform X2 n=1 Tax=Paramacrobiotus metropolitanus TaxID=2943436 RepID=UPI002445F867|nr:G-protein coupled receptor dmsr-1-like isoform X2 [Paramacrobiotus metropolitanus]